MNDPVRRRNHQFELAVVFLQVARRGRDIAVCLTQLKYVQQPDSACRGRQLQAERVNGFVLPAGLAQALERLVRWPESLPYQFLIATGEPQLATGSRRLVPAAESPSYGRLLGSQAGRNRPGRRCWVSGGCSGGKTAAARSQPRQAGKGPELAKRRRRRRRNRDAPRRPGFASRPGRGCRTAASHTREPQHLVPRVTDVSGEERFERTDCRRQFRKVGGNGRRAADFGGQDARPARRKRRRRRARCSRILRGNVELARNRLSKSVVSVGFHVGASRK